MTNSATQQLCLTRAERWLAGLDPYDLVSSAWRSGGIASIEAVAFDAISLHVTEVTAGIRGIKDEAAIEAHFVAAGITHGVIVTRTRTLYTVLVPPGSTRGWKEPGTSCIGRGRHTKFVAAPRSTRTSWPGGYWLLPAPDCPEQLSAPAKVRRLLRTGARP